MQKLYGLLILTLLTAPGCITTHQPKLTQAVIVPSKLTPGDTALITVKVVDRYNIVASVTGVVQEDKSITFDFRDDGTEGDEAALDQIWSMKVDVPFNAPPGGFTFVISAYDDNGNLIIVRDENKEAVGMTTTFTLEISYPETTPEGAPQ